MRKRGSVWSNLNLQGNLEREQLVFAPQSGMNGAEFWDHGDGSGRAF